MPEEINRLLTDQISDFLFVTEQSGLDNLKNEGIDEKKIFFVGNIMIDTLVFNLPKIKKSDIMNELKLKEKEFILLTMHRPRNVDNEYNLRNMFDILNEIQKETKIIYPIHPRTTKSIKRFGLEKTVKYMSNFIKIKPLRYIDFINLTLNCKTVLTDSGGIQEETTFLGVPCITIRENTERPVTVVKGTNLVVGSKKEKIMQAVDKVLNNDWKKGCVPELWDGKTAERIVKVLRNEYIN